MITIEKKVPMPMVGQKGRQTKYPFGSMEIGDSFYVDDRNPSQISSVAYNWCKRNNSKNKFVVKQEGKGTRVWRYQ
jgi:hypothetical protein